MMIGEILKIIKYPDPRLLQICDPVEIWTKELNKSANKMYDLILAHKGAGLAAPQVGINKRFFIDRYGVYINPEIVSFDTLTESTEGCLSIPGVIKTISRYANIEMKYYDTKMNLQRIHVSNFRAFVFQHEIDHLSGILIL